MAQAPIWMGNTQWREASRQVKVGPLDGRLMLFFLVLFLFPGKILFFISLAAVLFFYGLEYFGYTLPNAFRKMRVALTGNKKLGVHYWRLHKFKF